MKSRISRVSRTGAAVVEAAVVLPLLTLLLLGGIDVGRAIMVQHKLVTAARAACRLYCVPAECTPGQATAVIDQMMSGAAITAYTIGFTPATPAEIQHKQAVMASVSVPFDSIAWTPSWFLSGRTLTGTCTMPGDTSETN